VTQIYNLPLWNITSLLLAFRWKAHRRVCYCTVCYFLYFKNASRLRL